MYKKIGELYTYREMIKSLVRKDLRTRYKGSVLGFLWTFVNPLLQLVVYSIIFSTVMRVGVEDFPMFLFVGLIPWIFCSTTIIVGANVIVSEKDLIKKIYFPKMVLPISIVASNLINMLLSFIIVMLALLYYGYVPDFNVIYLPIIVLAELLFVLGITIIVSAVNVYFRDLQHILVIITMAWFYLTPIVYPATMIPLEYEAVFRLNPMFHVISSYRSILFYHQKPEIGNILIIIFLGIALILIGGTIFEKLEKGFAEEI